MHQPRLAARDLLQTSQFVTDLRFISSQNYSTLRCPDGYIHSRKNLNQEAGGSIIHTCIRLGSEPPYVSDIQMALSAIPLKPTTAAMLCPPGYQVSPVDLNDGVTSFMGGSMHLYPCIKFSKTSDSALTDVKIAWGNPDADPSCPSDAYDQITYNLNMGTRTGLKTFLCTSRTASRAPSSGPSQPSTSTLYTIHPVSEGWLSCLTMAGGMALASHSLAEGLRLGYWTCRVNPTKDQQFYLYNSNVPGAFQLRVSHTQKCMTGLNGHAAFVYQQSCETSMPDWQLWLMKDVGEGQYQVRCWRACVRWPARWPVHMPHTLQHACMLLRPPHTVHALALPRP